MPADSGLKDCCRLPLSGDEWALKWASRRAFWFTEALCSVHKTRPFVRAR